MTTNDLSAMWTSIAPAVGNHLWQSTLFAAAAALWVFVLRDNPARVRYRLWLAVSVKFLIPFSLLVALGSHVTWPAPPGEGMQACTYNGGSRTAFYSASDIGDFSQGFHGSGCEPSSTSFRRLSRRHGSAASMVVPFQMVRALATGFRSYAAKRYCCARGGSRDTSPTGGHYGDTEVRSSCFCHGDSLEPGVFGILRPVLIWPDGISERFRKMSTHLEAILAHELCHVRRRDNLAAAVHMTVEAIFWFHPLVWWLGARLS